MSETPVMGYLAYIPSPVLHHDTLSANAKLFYAEITALSNKYGYCFASNAYLAEQFKMSERTASRLISELEELHFITVKIVKNAQTGKVEGRRIYPDVVASELIPEGEVILINHTTKLSAPVDKIVQDHTTNLSTGYLINNKINNNLSACAGASEKKPSGRKKTDAEPRAELIRWAKENFPNESEELVSALMRYCDMRCAKKGWMMETLDTAKRCEQRLMDFSEGNVPMMIAILEQSIGEPWKGVFALKPDDPFWRKNRQVACRTKQSSAGSDEEWL